MQLNCQNVTGMAGLAVFFYRNRTVASFRSDVMVTVEAKGPRGNLFLYVAGWQHMLPVLAGNKLP
jgi:hypothetical protein